MAKLDGVSLELYPGEVEHFQKTQRQKKESRTDFAIWEDRQVERKVASGYKIVYKNIGGFRG